MTTELKQAKKELDATKHEEFVDWRFEEWLEEFEEWSPGRVCPRKENLPPYLQVVEGREWLRSAFHAGAKR